jgi:signal transduction histidine kinase
LGLGLYMAKSIISSHHGELRVFNHTKGVQVEVTFVLD